MKLTHPCAGSIALGLAVLAGLSASGRAGEKPEPEKHWAFQPIERPSVPGISDPEWSRNPIDRFVFARFEAEGVTPAPAADRRTLLRRLYLDLIGLPPTPHEVRDFLDDRSPDAVARVVDRLLASPHYGERWARHWLDVVRYAETNGYERDGAKPNAWRYRDYVIDALNRDKPYNRFVTEQLAGDELDGSDATAQIATTFLRLGTWDDEPAEPKVDRYDQLDDVLGTAATAFLGITLRCAAVPRPQVRAVFAGRLLPHAGRLRAAQAPAERPRRPRPPGRHRSRAGRLSGQPGQVRGRLCRDLGADRGADQARDRPSFLRRPRPRRTASNRGNRHRCRPLAVAAFQTRGCQSHAGPANWSSSSSPRNSTPRLGNSRLDEVEGRDSPPGRTARAPSRRPHKELPRAYIWYEDGPNAPVTHVLKRGDPTSPAPPSSRGCRPCSPPKQPGPAEADRQDDRAQALAGPLADQPGKPAGRARDRQPDLAVSFRPGDWSPRRAILGVMGDAPTHPELLDWLASELIASGWRLKPLHRMIVLSQTYQRSSAVRAGSRQGRPGQHVALALAAAASRGRSRPRLDPGGQRPVEPTDGRPRLLSDSSRAQVLAGQSRARRGLGQVRRTRTSPPQHLHLRQAQPGGPRARAARHARHHQ